MRCSLYDSLKLSGSTRQSLAKHGDFSVNRSSPNLWLLGEGCGEGIFREFGMGMDTLLYLKWIANKDLLYGTGGSAQYHVTAWMGGAFGGEWIHAYVWLSPFPIHLKLSQHCSSAGYASIQNKKFKIKYVEVH